MTCILDDPRKLYFLAHGWRNRYYGIRGVSSKCSAIISSHNEFNHTIKTEKTATKAILNAETEFHVYALEWTEDKITAL